MKKNTQLDIYHQKEGKGTLTGNSEPLSTIPEVRPSMYATLPNHIKKDWELCTVEKMLYAEISITAKSFGYCYSDDDYFSKLLGYSFGIIQQSMKALVMKEYITIMRQGTKIRMIYISRDREEKERHCPTKSNSILYNNIYTIRYTNKELYNTIIKNINTSIYNNTIINNNNNTNNTNIYNIYNKELPSWLGKSPITRQSTVYTLQYEQITGAYPDKTFNKKDKKALKKLVKKYGEYKTALMIMLNFTWKGWDNEDDILQKKIRENDFPIGWIKQNAEVYNEFIRIKLKIKNHKEAVDRVDSVLKEYYNP